MSEEVVRVRKSGGVDWSWVVRVVGRSGVSWGVGGLSVSRGAWSGTVFVASGVVGRCRALVDDESLRVMGWGGGRIGASPSIIHLRAKGGHS